MGCIMTHPIFIYTRIHKKSFSITIFNVSSTEEKWQKSQKMESRWEDGSLHPNLKQISMEQGFSVERYAVSVSNELIWALEGLVEER